MTSPLPILHPRHSRLLPDYLPARMLNEFVYCPRLFFYEWVEGVFRESADTIEGSLQHARVDQPGPDLPPAGELDEDLKTRSVSLASDRLKLIARLDVVQASGGVVCPVDYKHGRPMELPDGGLAAWPADRMQMAAQALVLRDNGYRCDEGIVFYQTTRQRVRIAFDDALVAEAETALQAAWRTAAEGVIPPPLEDSPKCVGCSLAPVCLPDETAWLGQVPSPDPVQLGLFADGVPPPRKGRPPQIRRLVAPRDDQKPLYVNTQGLRIGKSGGVLQVKDKDKVVDEIRVNDVCQVNLLGNVQITTQAMQALFESEVPVCYFSAGGWFYGMASGLVTKNVFLRQAQFEHAAQPWFAVRLARSLVAAKIRNQRVQLMRNHVEPNAVTLSQMKRMAEKAEDAAGLEELLGLEGNAARLYFGAFPGLLKNGDPDGELPAVFRFEMDGRNRRPPRDAVNAMLSLAYSVLAKDLTLACSAVGFDPMMGYLHQPRFGRPALALDLMEPFRPLIADSAVITAINTGMVAPRDFVSSGGAVGLTTGGRKAFFRAYEARMDTLVTHPLFDYRVSYRRMLEIQARLLAKMLTGEIEQYVAFVSR